MALNKSSHHVYITPHGRKIECLAGSNLLSSLAEHSIFLRSDCGGRGVCGKCLVKIRNAAGNFATKPACQVMVTEDIVIEIPRESMLSSNIIQKAMAILPASFIRSRKKDMTLPVSYGVAVDLGTTTLALYFCDMTTGSVLSSLSIKNPQSMYGDDVMSRIGVAVQKSENLQRLQKLVVTAVEWGCEELAMAQGLEIGILEKMVIVGNPVMIHIFLGINPESIGIAPYQPVFFEEQCVESAQLGCKKLNCSVYTLPQISGFIGGDILAAAIAAEINEQPAGTLLVDIGTNGELIYKGNQGLYATSCATGPAFEGASISCGIQAIPNAIDKVIITGKRRAPRYSIIPAGKKNAGCSPVGLCGSGVISAAAELYRAKLVDKTGALSTDSKNSMLKTNSSGMRQYIIAPKDNDDKTGSVRKEITISQKDIRSIQLGKAALISGIEFLLRKAGLSKLKKVIIAGAFGSYLDKDDMMTLGMIPRLEKGEIEIAGNLAGAGAVMVLCDSRYLELARELAAKIEVIDLATNPEFQKVFVGKLSFPTDVE